VDAGLVAEVEAVTGSVECVSYGERFAGSAGHRLCRYDVLMRGRLGQFDGSTEHPGGDACKSFPLC
jgi:hypothetical protein